MIRLDSVDLKVLDKGDFLVHQHYPSLQVMPDLDLDLDFDFVLDLGIP